MYDGPSSLAATGAGIGILGYSLDVTALLAFAVLLSVTGLVLFVRARGKRGVIL